MDPPGGELFGFTVVQRLGDFLVIGVGADLHARIEPIITLVFIFQDKIAVMLLGAEERVGGAIDGCTDNGSLLNGVLGDASLLCPAGEIFFIEEILKTLFLRV